MTYSIDWNKSPIGNPQGLINVNAGNRSFSVGVKAWNPANQEQDSIKGFIGPNAYISIEAVDYSKLVNCNGNKWMVVLMLGLPAMESCPTPIWLRINIRNLGHVFNITSVY